MKPRKESFPLYLYGLIRSDAAFECPSIGIGEGGAPSPVFAVKTGGIAALVSPRKDSSPIAPRRADVDAHQRVLALALETGTVLPFAFGQVAPNEQAVTTFLRTYSSEVRDELIRLDGKVQMGLKIQWDVENLYGYVLDRDPELLEFGRRVFASEATIEEKIELGSRFEARLQEMRAEAVDRLAAALPMLAAPPQGLPLHTDNAVAHLMLLMDRNEVGRFREGIERIAEAWPEEYEFRVTGPWPPFHYMELELPWSGEGAQWAS